MQPDQKILSQIAYDPTTGMFTWRVNKTRVKIGDKAGRLNTYGHRQIGINNRRYLAHRLAWWICWGVWPDFMLDHINGDPDDNRISNLRPSNHSLNNQNTRLRKDNISGYKGVFWDKRDHCWKAYLRLNKKAIHLGTFSTKEDAINARQNAQERWHPHHRKGCE